MPIYKHTIEVYIKIVLNHDILEYKTDCQDVTITQLQNAYTSLDRGQLPYAVKVNNQRFYLGEDLLKKSIMRLVVQDIESEEELEDDLDAYCEEADSPSTISELDSFFEDLSSIEDMDDGGGLLIDDGEGGEILFKD